MRLNKNSYGFIGSAGGFDRLRRQSLRRLFARYQPLPVFPVNNKELMSPAYPVLVIVFLAFNPGRFFKVHHLSVGYFVADSRIFNFCENFDKPGLGFLF